jgi:predicted nuclease with TOPRIM domain
VLDDLTNMTTLLHQVERERTTEEECLKELHRIRGELHRVEERLAQQKELLSNIRNNMAESHRRVARGRAECIGLSKTCLSLGIGVKGRSYK